MSNQNFVFVGNTPIFYRNNRSEQLFFPTGFPNCASNIIQGYNESDTWISAIFAHNGYSVIYGRIGNGIILSEQNSNVLSPIRLQCLFTLEPGNFKLGISGGRNIHLYNGHVVLCGQRYEWNEYKEVIDVDPDTGLPGFYVYADAEVTESRRVFINGIDTGVWREEGRVHEM